MTLMLHHTRDYVQAVTLMVLGNCMVDAVTKEAMRSLLAPASVSRAQLPAGACLSSLMQSPNPVVRERALTLCGNMCSDTALRRELLVQPIGLVSAAVHAACGRSSSSSSDASTAGDFTSPSSASPRSAPVEATQVQLAAATMLYNASIEEEAQRALLADNLLVSELLGLMCHADLRLGAKAAGVVARCCKHPLRNQYLLQGQPVEAGGSFCSALLALLRRCSQADGVADVAAPIGNKEEIVAEARYAAVDAVTRALALLTHDEGPEGTGCIAELLSLGAGELLLSAVGQQLPLKPPASSSSTSTTGVPVAAAKPVTRESILGNAALCLGHLARSDAALPLLAACDAVAPLVRTAYEGKGSVASKNAAIALARMSRQPAMLVRLRELHGIEIIYQ